VCPHEQLGIEQLLNLIVKTHQGKIVQVIYERSLGVDSTT
jgi:hypothetical protein